MVILSRRQLCRTAPADEVRRRGRQERQRVSTRDVPRLPLPEVLQGLLLGYRKTRTGWSLVELRIVG